MLNYSYFILHFIFLDFILSWFLITSANIYIEINRKAVRATLILIPLLGLHYILVPFRPETKSAGEAVYEVVATIVTSFQVSHITLKFDYYSNASQFNLISTLIENFYYSNLSLFLSQGFCVAMLFCFCNGEVIIALRTFVNQQMLMRSKHPYKFRSRVSFQSTIV